MLLNTLDGLGFFSFPYRYLQTLDQPDFMHESCQADRKEGYLLPKVICKKLKLFDK